VQVSIGGKLLPNSVETPPVYMRNRRNTTSFTAWIRAVTAVISECFFLHNALFGSTAELVLRTEFRIGFLTNSGVSVRHTRLIVAC
jgi:hypothetical protein